MRPKALFPLFAEITALPGIGPRNKALFERLAGSRVIDLLWHLPTGLVDRRRRPKIGEAPEGEIVTLEIRVETHEPGAGSRSPYRVLVSDETGFLALVFFHPRVDWLRRVLPPGERRIVSGRLERFHGAPQIAHPDYILPPEEAASLPALEPVYPLTQGLSRKQLHRAVAAVLERLPELPEWLVDELLRREGWPGWRDAVTAAHAPQSPQNLEPGHSARRRLAYDELLANQLALGLVRRRARRGRGRALTASGEIKDRLLGALPYRLTGDQERALAEIEADMAAAYAMLRLLQGDVGSGKTVVALVAMAHAVEAGCQAALLAPTEILARQHYETITPLAAAAGLHVDLLTGRVKGRAREELLERLAAGEIDILVGTHALLTEDVAFKDLAFVVVDEQHRFGVSQRLALTGKAQAGVDVLVMTATPIPRTLTLTVYGDMEVSRIREKPPGRKPVDTRVISLERLEEVVAGIMRAVDSGAQVYWVCPLVAESEDSDLAAAEARFDHLKRQLGDRVGLVHGRMKGAEKDRVMEAFAAGELRLLVATTVIEVGVDVADATVMVIEHAERFGLAQLHQLRGRVGRGAKPSRCLLLRAAHTGETARARLNILRESEDGFAIAEEDLRLRGAGELLGTRQSGLPEFRLADLEAHADLMAMAHDEARLIIERDPELQGERGPALRALLYLFERDAAVKFLKGG